MNIIVVGAGMIGKERIKALELLGENITCVVDTAYPHLKYKWMSDIKFSGEVDNADWVFVCTPHDETARIVEYLLELNMNILVEKPLGRTLDEYYSIMNYKQKHATNRINLGFNYRFFKGVRQLLIDCQNKVFGDLVSVNMILSLGDGPGSEKTWRLDPEKSGMGAILDPGIHLIDLAMLISKGSLRPIHAYPWSGFWNTGIEEEMHLLATDENETIYNIQASVCHWRNTFRIEVNGTEGYGIVEGRNRFYGNQTYRRGVRWGWKSGKSQRDSEELIVDYDGEDSFIEETKAVLNGCKDIQPGTHEDNRRCLEFIDKL